MIVKPLEIVSLSTKNLTYKPAYCVLLKNQELPYGAVRSDYLPLLYCDIDTHLKNIRVIDKLYPEDGIDAYFPAPLPPKSSWYYESALTGQNKYTSSHKFVSWDHMNIDEWFEMNSEFVGGNIYSTPYHAEPIIHKFSDSLFEINKNHRILHSTAKNLTLLYGLMNACILRLRGHIYQCLLRSADYVV